VSARAKAIELDVAGRIEDAAEQYERAIAERGVPIEAFLNLAFIYWQATDYGFLTTHGLTPAFVERADTRCSEILEEAQDRYPDHLELVFWSRYFDYMTLGEPPLDDGRFLEAMKRDRVEASLVYLFPLRPTPECLPAVRRMIADAEREPTTKNRYIVAVLRGALNRFADDCRSDAPSPAGDAETRASTEIHPTE